MDGHLDRYHTLIHQYFFMAPKGFGGSVPYVST
jgi:hypothetical protein